MIIHRVLANILIFISINVERSKEQRSKNIYWKNLGLSLKYVQGRFEITEQNVDSRLETNEIIMFSTAC